MQNANDMHVPVVRLLVMQPPNNVHLGTAVVDRLLASSENLFVAHRVALRIAKV